MDPSGGDNDNMTFLFEDILKYMGKPSGHEDMHQGLEKIWNQFVDWEDSNSTMPPIDWDNILLGDRIEPSISQYTRIRTGLLATILIFTTVVGIVVNAVVTTLAIRHHRKLQTSRVVLIVNLCLTCLLFLVGGMPLLIVENVFGAGWNHGEAACQIHRYLVYGSFYLISYSIVLLLLHVTMVLWVPLKLVQIDKPIYSIIACVVLWLLVLVSNIPNYLGHGVTDEIPGISYCYHKEISSDLYKVRAWTTIQFCFSFALPALLIVTLTLMTTLRICGAPPSEYAQLHEVTSSRRDVTSLCVSLAAGFLICWMPDKVFSLYVVFKDYSTRMGLGLLVSSDLMMCLAYSNPSINAVLILICILRNFLPCKSRDQARLAEESSVTSEVANQNREYQNQPIINPEDKLIISVV